MKIWDHCSKVSVRARVIDLQIRAKDEFDGNVKEEKFEKKEQGN